MSKCLVCTKPVDIGDNYHPKCLQALFGSKEEPALEFGFDELSELAKKSVHQRVSVPGVQSKLSLEINRKTKGASKLTIVGLWGRYILKPPSISWPQLPENEHCTMMRRRLPEPRPWMRLRIGLDGSISRRRIR